MKIAPSRCAATLSIVLFLMLSVQSAVQAQSSSGFNSMLSQEQISADGPADILGIQVAPRIPLMVPEESIYALDEPIDPASYVLGPGDVIGVNLRSGTGSFYQTTVTPDGNLLVPRLPMLRVEGMTLADAINKAKAAWGGSSSANMLDLSLLQMRAIRVSAGGAVVKPGQFIATPADRASTLAALAGGLVENESSLRRAWLVRSSGERVHVDLLRFLRSGDKDANPRLQTGDHLVVEEQMIASAHITIGGGVLMPGTYEWVKGDHLLDLVDVAGGLTSEANSDSIRIERFDNQGPSETIWVSLNRMEEGNRGLELQPGDVISVAQVIEIPRSASVSLQGEVKNPGVYPVIEGKTTLSELIHQAGGFTSFAYLPGGRVYKEQSLDDFRSLEADRIDSLAGTERDELDLEFFKYYYRTQSRDYLPVDMEMVFGENGTINKEADVTLFDSLIVNIPRQPKLVLVAGQVKAPGYYPFKDGMDVGDYIDLAGGYARGAQKNRLRLVTFESPLWQHPRGGTPVEAGSMIFVPVKQVGTDWEMFRDIIGIVLQFATLYLLAVRTLQ